MAGGAEPALNRGQEGGADGAAEQAAEIAGHRQLEQAALLAEPEGAMRRMFEVRAADRPEIGERHDAGVDVEAELLEQVRAVVVEAVAAGLEHLGLDAEMAAHGLDQTFDLGALQVPAEIGGVGIAAGQELVEGRVGPGVELDADIGPALVEKAQEDLAGLGVGGDRVVDQIGRLDAVAVEQPLGALLMADRRRAVIVARKRRRASRNPPRCR